MQWESCCVPAYLFSSSFCCNYPQMCGECTFFSHSYVYVNAWISALSLLRSFFIAVSHLFLQAAVWNRNRLTPVFENTYLHLYKYHNTSEYNIILELFTFIDVFLDCTKNETSYASLYFQRSKNVSLMLLIYIIYINYILFIYVKPVSMQYFIYLIIYLLIY